MKMILCCRECGKEFTTYPSKIKLGKGKYCSKECCLKNTNSILAKNGVKTRFIKNHKTIQKDKNHWNWNGGKTISEGYIKVLDKDNVLANKRGYILLHRKIVSENGYLLNSELDVHHRDGNKQNNNLDNLEVLQHGIHSRITQERRWCQCPL